MPSEEILLEDGQELLAEDGEVLMTEGPDGESGDDYLYYSRRKGIR